MKKPYGMEVILDLKNCDPATFNRQSLHNYFIHLCRVIDMEMCDVHYWDDVGVPEKDRQTNPKTKGTSAVCFILTSSIVVHTLDDLKTVYINIFSCKEFEPNEAVKVSTQWFGGEIADWIRLERI